MAIDLDSLLQPLDPLPASNVPSPPPPPRQPLWWRIGQVASAYLPLILMALLALATWWLVRNTPRADEPQDAVAVRHEPDYTMQGFKLQRFDAEGALRVQVEGTQMRHYPDTDTFEIDEATIRATSPEGIVTVASARRALSNGAGTEVQLQGGARVVRPAGAHGEVIEFDGEFLHAFLDSERVRSHLPVRMRQGTTELRVSSIDYDNIAQFAKLGGPLKARFEPPPRR